jgi:predicted Fe-Mo cluster-binding NifX family protein
LRVVFPVNEFRGLQSLIEGEFKNARYLVLVELLEDGDVGELSYVEVGGYESPASLVRRKNGGVVICDSVDDFSRACLLVLGVEVIQGFRGTVKEGLEKYLRGELTPPYPKTLRDDGV